MVWKRSKRNSSGLFTVLTPTQHSRMRFTPKSLLSKLWPHHPKKKLIGSLKGSGKMLASGLLFGGGLEMAGAIARKSQNTEANNGAQ